MKTPIRFLLLVFAPLILATAVLQAGLPPGADLAVTKTVDAKEAPAGSNITYTIHVINNGPNSGPFVQLFDPLPANLTFVSITSPAGWQCAAPNPGSGGNVICNNPSVPAGSDDTFTLVVNIPPDANPGTVFTNTASVSVKSSDPDQGNNSASAVTAVRGPNADLGVTKVADAKEASAGSNITYTIHVTNNGPDSGPFVQLFDPLPAGTTFVSLTSPAGWQCTTPMPGAGGNVFCNNPSVPVGSDDTFTLVVNIPPATQPGTVFTNVATVSTKTQDPNKENNSASAVTVVPVPNADLGVNKTVDREQALAGENVTYSIQVVNGGPNNAPDAELDDTLPGNMTFVSFSGPAGWTCTTPVVGAGGTIVCTRSDLPVGSTSNFTLVGHIPSTTPPGTEYLNTASVSSSVDGNPENNTANASTAVVVAAPTLTTVASPSVQLGGSIFDTGTLTGGFEASGTITFIVYGPDDATCGGAEAFSSTVSVNGDGNYVSGSFTPTAPGTYRFVALYSGDIDNRATSTACNDPNESVVVTPLPTPTPSPTPVPTPTPTASPTPTPAPTATPTPTPTATPTPAPTATPTPTPAPTATATPAPTATATATPSPTATATPAPTATATPAPTATATPAPTATVTPSATPTPTPAAQTVNFSTRMRVEVGDKVGIGGFIIAGNAPKHVIVRGIGPSLERFDLPGVLGDPVLELHGPSGFTTVLNDNWRDTQEMAIQATGLAPTHDLESAIDATLAPGSYTAVVKGKNNTSGLALVEIYDLNPSTGELANISTRASVETGDNIVIAGVVLSGDGAGPGKLVLRGIGPSLAPAFFPASAVLANPTLELRDENGTLLVANDDWQDNPVQAAEITAAGLAPSNSLESAIAASLPPGFYTLLLSGLNDETGIGLVEIYNSN